MRRILASVVAGALALTLAACSGGNDDLVKQYQSGTGKGYISGDGRVQEIPVESERQRGKKEIVSLTVRLHRAEWERLHQFAVSEGVSIQTLMIRGLDRVFTEKGLPKLTER